MYQTLHVHIKYNHGSLSKNHYHFVLKPFLRCFSFLFRARTPSTTTATTSSSSLQRKGSNASDTAQGQSRRGGVPTPIDQRAPFRS